MKEIKAINPFTGELAYVNKYYFRGLDNVLTIKYGFIYKKKFVEVRKEFDIVEIIRVYDRDEYIEAVYYAGED